MADQRLSKRTALPSPLIADMVYFIKGSSDTKTMIYVTTTTTPVTAIPIAYVSDAELTVLLAGKQDKFSGTTAQYVRGDGSLATLDKAAVGLNLIPNLAPADWPVSTATTTELNTKIPLAQKGAINGVATLDAGGKVPASQLPSYVDDVLEFANLAAFPATGETGKMYVALDTNMLYRWSGSVYVKISSGDVTEMGNFFVRYDAVQSLSAPNQARARTNIGALGASDLSTYATIAGSDAKYVRFDAVTSLTAPQQTQARANIGAASAASLASYLPLAGGALTGALTGTSATFSGDVSGNTLESTAAPSAGSLIGVTLKNGASSRWQVGKLGLETGSNTGSNLHIARFNDAGVFNGFALIIERSSGNATFSGRVSGAAPTSDGDFVNRLYGNTNYAAKADTYTKTEVNNLVNATNQWEATAW